MLRRRTPEETGKILVELRDGRTRPYVARKIGVSVSALQSYEEGRRNPSDEVKVRIASDYGKSMDEIFFAV